MGGISNAEIEKYFNNEPNEDIYKKKKKLRVMSSDSLTQFLNFKKILKTEKAPYPFIIMNTSRKNKAGIHWWSVLNTDSKNEMLLFDSEGFEGFKFFILSNDETLIDKLLYDVNKFNKTDNKINLVTVQFSLPAYEKLKENKLKLLTTTAQDLFHVLAKFARYNNIKTDVKLTMVDDELQ